MTMKLNAIKLTDEHGEEIYLTDIDMICDEYISSLPDSEMIFKAKTFVGMLQEIYNRCIKNIPYKAKKGCKYDYALLDGIFWGIYCPLCAKYGSTVSVFGFANFVHIGMGNLADIRNGIYRGSGYQVAEESTHIVKGWYDASQASIISNVLESNSIGGIFILKAAYGMVEQPQPVIEEKHDPDIVDISFLSNDYNDGKIPVLHPIE